MQVSLNMTAPVSRYSLVRQVAVAVAAVVKTVALATAASMIGATVDWFIFTSFAGCAGFVVFADLSSSSSLFLTLATFCLGGAAL